MIMNNKLDNFLGALALAVASTPAFASGSDDQGFFGLPDWLGVPLSVLFFGMLFFLYYIQLKGEKEERIHKRETAKQAAKFASDTHNKMLDIINKHVPTLAVKYRQLMTEDAYGIVDTSGFLKEVEYFIENVLSADDAVKSYLLGVDTGDYGATLSAITAQKDALLKQSEKGKAEQSEIDELNSKVSDIRNKMEKRDAEAKQIIFKLVSEYRINEIEHQEGKSVDVERLNPIQFEHYCAELLNSTGWNARVTQASGDQGVDVIAQHGNVKAVFQCKKYSQPVGNAAVQEIIAGKAFEQAHIAAVVSNATFTSSATQLASTTGVFLLHFSELPRFAAKLGLVEPV